MNYYIKEIPGTKVLMSNGHAVPFEVVNEDVGILATENEFIINELSRFVAARVGGVIATDKAGYEALKKKAGLPVSRQRFRNEPFGKNNAASLSTQLKALRPARSAPVAAKAVVEPPPSVSGTRKTPALVVPPPSAFRPATKRVKLVKPSFATE